MFRSVRRSASTATLLALSGALSGALSAMLLSGLQGCSHPLTIIVPKDFHGTVVINCTSVGTAKESINTDMLGSGQGTCPAFQESLNVLRDGQHAYLQGSPLWDQTSDGNTKAIRFVVQP